MIQELTVQDFAIISSLNVPFKEGMTVLTGETGAGKSIIIDAMGLLVGGRGSTDFIREGTERCRVEGSFYIPETPGLLNLLEENGIEFSEGQLVLQREIYQTGRNVCRVNGQLVTTKVLREIGTFIVDIHGQNEHQELMQASQHLKLLDQYAPEELTVLKNSYQAQFLKYQELNHRFMELMNNEQAYAQRMDMLAFQYNEISDANLIEGEEERLLEERRKLMNFQKIVEALQKTYHYLEGEEVGAVSLAGAAMNELEQIEEMDPVYRESADLLRTAYYSLQESLGGVSSSLEQLEMDESRLVEVENRLDMIRQLKRKYGESVSEILTYFKNISKELEDNQQAGGSTEELREELERIKHQLNEKAKEMTELRRQTAVDLEQAIMEQLSELYMERTVFSVQFEESDLSIDGADKVEFYICTNVGESLKPLVKVASGGELSRMMLALKTIFSVNQSMTSVVFDEVDTGVSGRVAQAIAEKIHQIGQHSQVLCITHLPQVAAISDTQYFIKKEVKTNRTETSIKELSDSERIDEIARMLSGVEVTELTKEHAKELLMLAQK